MTSPQIIPDRLAVLDSLTLHEGNHDSFDDGHCAMEVVAWLAGQGHTDAPSCASPVLRRYVIRLNDRWGTEERQALKPYLPRMVGTGNDGLDELREQVALQASADLLVPWLRLAGLDSAADQVVGAGGAEELWTALRGARAAAWDLRRERINTVRAAVRARLSVDAVVDAVAASAAVDAVAVDAVAAVATVAADAGKDPWWNVYNAARDYFRENPITLRAEITALAARQQTAALDLLDKLIDPRPKVAGS